VWDVAILRGLDARARTEIEAAGRIRALRSGELAHRVGEPADAIAVVVKGRVSLVAVRRGETASSVIRRVGPGEVFGEDSTVLQFGTRQMDARCDEDTTVADVPLGVLRRALGRAGAEDVAARLERALRRAATQDLLRTSAFTRALPDRDVEILLDASRHVHVARGEHLYREGDPSEAAFIVADGLLQAQTDDDGKPRVEAYLSRGDLFGDAELEDRSSRAVSVAASGPAWLVAIPRDVFVVVARRNTALLEGVRRVRGETALPRALAGGATTAHVFKDLYRMRVARSLLVIDQDSCVRCGHCAWSCASAHDDGISRLIRRGERVVVKKEDDTAPLLVPNSCQHCKNPACMIDCPTGAIGRDARGEVFIREELCTGCGQCAKACPWENISMAPRKAADAKKTGFAEVAVKCDLCSGAAAGPACVAACPTEAIVRIDPNEALVELGARNAKPALPPRTPAWPWIAGAAAAAIAGAFVSPPKLASGIVAGVLVVALAAYAALRRAPKLTQRMSGARRLGRIAYTAHLAIGVVCVGALAAHASHLGNDAGGALALAMIVALASGAFGAALQAVMPSRLARLERKVVMPEELATRAKDLDEKLFSHLSGKSELVKTLYAKLLRPYRMSLFGPLLLVVTGRSLRDEEKHLHARIFALLDGRTKTDKIKGTDDLVRIVVEHRAIRAQRLLSFSLRAWVPLHVVAAAASIVLLAAHIIGVFHR
jgi:Fe-S-cluster-containing dehydrogenase component/CRP-like cAMP-binding protein